MIQKIARITVPFLLLATLIGCKKEEKEQNKLVGSWSKIKMEVKTTTTDWQIVNEPCQLDNVEEYKGDGNYAIYVGTVQCSPGESGIYGTWKQVANNTKIIYTYSGVSGEYESNIEELTASRLVTTHATGNLAGEQYRETYQKQ
ncbi:MAG: hypothetical protein K9G49_03095 [Taibaiella sp.]|nr:hypothetical protein [Taibaiella sp.]